MLGANVPVIDAEHL